MRHLNGVYTQRWNRCHGRGGHLLLAVAELLSEFSRTAPTAIMAFRQFVDAGVTASAPGKNSVPPIRQKHSSELRPNYVKILRAPAGCAQSLDFAAARAYMITVEANWEERWRVGL
jgi:hypothetical protein